MVIGGPISFEQIAQGFIVSRGDVDRREFAGAMQSRQRIAVPPIGLDPIAASFRHARRIDRDAIPRWVVR